MSQILLAINRAARQIVSKINAKTPSVSTGAINLTSDCLKDDSNADDTINLAIDRSKRAIVETICGAEPSESLGGIDLESDCLDITANYETSVIHLDVSNTKQKIVQSVTGITPDVSGDVNLDGKYTTFTAGYTQDGITSGIDLQNKINDIPKFLAGTVIFKTANNFAPSQLSNGLTFPACAGPGTLILDFNGVSLSTTLSLYFSAHWQVGSLVIRNGTATRYEVRNNITNTVKGQLPKVNLNLNKNSAATLSGDGTSLVSVDGADVTISAGDFSDLTLADKVWIYDVKNGGSLRSMLTSAQLPTKAGGGDTLTRQDGDGTRIISPAGSLTVTNSTTAHTQGTLQMGYLQIGAVVIFPDSYQSMN